MHSFESPVAARRMATLIDGKRIAAELRSAIAAQVRTLQHERAVTPGLAVVLVGEHAASQVYVRNKSRLAQDAGMNSFVHRLPSDTSLESLLALVVKLNVEEINNRVAASANP